MSGSHPGVSHHRPVTETAIPRWVPLALGVAAAALGVAITLKP